MAHLLSQDVLWKVAGGGSSGTGALWTPIAVNAGGYDRAAVVLGRGAEAGATKGQFSASVYESASSGGTYTLISGSLGTSGTGSTNKALILDIAVDGTKPFLKIYGTASTSGTSAIPVVGVVSLYRGSRILPPGQDIAVINA